MTGGSAGGFGTCVCVLVSACNAFIHPPPPLCGNLSHIFELHARGKAQVHLSHLLLAKDGDCKLLPSPWPTSPKSTHPRRQTLARRLASVCLSSPFFASALACSASTGAVVWWGWHPRSLLTERRMVVHPGAGSFPTPPPPTRPPHGPDAASRPSCINDPEYITNKICLKFELKKRLKIGVSSGTPLQLY